MTEEDDPPVAPDAGNVGPPPPEETASAGTQAAAPPTPETAIVQVVAPFEHSQQHVGAVLSAYVEGRSPVVMALAVAAYRDAESLRAAVMRKWDEAEHEKAEYRERWHEEATRVAVLQDRERSQTRLQQTRAAILAFGGVVAGAGLSVAIAERGILNVGGLLCAIGLVVMVLGLPIRGRKE